MDIIYRTNFSDWGQGGRDTAMSVVSRLVEQTVNVLSRTACIGLWRSICLCSGMLMKSVPKNNCCCCCPYSALLYWSPGLRMLDLVMPLSLSSLVVVLSLVPASHHILGPGIPLGNVQHLALAYIKGHPPHLCRPGHLVQSDLEQVSVCLWLYHLPKPSFWALPGTD
jgi:hypothetical protein